ncbi:MAG: Coq4 family protein [Hyphomonadaceae bacterium]
MNKLFADKEDTAQVFHIIESLSGNALHRNLDRLLSTPDGRERFAEHRALAPLLDDHAALGPLPAGSVGRAYIDFMTREGLTARGLVAESEIFRKGTKQFDDDLKWFGDRLRDTHDMYHVLSGYGRDGLGEAALLAFTHGQQPSRGVYFIAKMAFRRMRKELPASFDLKEVWREARENGLAARKILDQDILSLLNEPLAEARGRLNIKPPKAYKAALRLYSELPQEMRELTAA